MADKFQLKALITGVDKLSPKLAGIRKNISSFQKGLEKTGLGKIGFQDVVTGGALAAPFVVGIKAAIDYESQMADVKKVVNFDTPQQFKQMGDDIGRMSERLPMAAGDIAKIVAAGGQSGIAREELLGFAEAAVKMGIAFDQTAEESGDMMSTWRTAFRMNQAEVVGLADKINYLGNTGPANTKQISAIVTEVGALGEVAGLSSGQIAAIGATMAGVGVKQDVAATGIKNFMLAMTKGSAATKSQAEAFKALRLDSKSVAEAMQKDAQGTTLELLKRISNVDAAKRPALLTNLFGSESITAITPLLTNLELLKSNLSKVADEKEFSGSMDKEYASRAATTANNLQLLRNTVESVARALGNALLPGVNMVIDALRPMIGQVAELVAANPNLMRGLVMAGAAFTAIRVAVLAATVATRLMGVAFAATPIGLIAMGIAAAAGLIVANWGQVGPFFSALWGLMAAVVQRAKLAWDEFVVSNPALTKSLMGAAAGFLAMRAAMLASSVVAKIFSVSMAVVRGAVIAATVATRIFNLVAKANPFVLIASLIAMAAGALIANWEPALKWFKDAWDKISGYVKSIMAAFGVVGGGGVEGAMDGATKAVNNMTLQVAPARAGNGDGTLLRPKPAGERWSPMGDSLVKNAMAASQPKLQGEMVMRFEGAPPGLRVDPAKTNQPGLSVTPSVGYRTIGAGGRQ